MRQICDLNPIELRRCFIDVSYKKQSLTFIVFIRSLNRKKAMKNVPLFGSKATASVLRIFTIL